MSLGKERAKSEIVPASPISPVSRQSSANSLKLKGFWFGRSFSHRTGRNIAIGLGGVFAGICAVTGVYLERNVFAKDTPSQIISPPNSSFQDFELEAAENIARASNDERDAVLRLSQEGFRFIISVAIDKDRSIRGAVFSGGPNYPDCKLPLVYTGDGSNVEFSSPPLPFVKPMRVNDASQLDAMIPNLCE